MTIAVQCGHLIFPCVKLVGKANCLLHPEHEITFFFAAIGAVGVADEGAEGERLTAGFGLPLATVGGAGLIFETSLQRGQRMAVALLSSAMRSFWPQALQSISMPRLKE